RTRSCRSQRRPWRARATAATSGHLKAAPRGAAVDGEGEQPPPHAAVQQRRLSYGRHEVLAERDRVFAATVQAAAKSREGQRRPGPPPQGRRGASVRSRASLEQGVALLVDDLLALGDREGDGIV